MKSILMSIKPEWIEKILNGSKTIEIRKTKPKCELPCKVYIYCTKGQELWGDGTGNTWHGIDENEDMERVFELTPTLARLNSKVVAEFTLNKVEKLENTILPTIPSCVYLTKTKRYANAVEKESCLSQDEIYTYLSGRDGYAWHIDDLIIYDEPKELKLFSKFGYKPLYNSVICGNRHCPFFIDSNCYDLPPECSLDRECILKRPPQSWCYVEEKGDNL